MAYLANRKSFPENVTSYDVLKTVALLIMIIDHMGHYFFPENEWLRLIGRMCVPMWFFLIGYAQSRDLSTVLWVGGGILVVMSFIVGLPVFPLNILFTIICVRLLLDVFIQRMLQSRFDGFMGALSLVVLLLPTMYLVEYGTLGIVLAFLGYIARHKESLGFDKQTVMKWLILISLFFGGSQILISGIVWTQFQMILLFGGSSAIMVSLYLWFESKTFSFKNSVLSFFGRYTLEVYVIHLVIFKLIAVSIGMPNFEWFRFVLFL